MAANLNANCVDLLRTQSGVIARWQAPAVGLGGATIDARLRRGRWQPLYRGVYATFTGPPGRESLLWGAVLRAGPGAALSHQSAAELDNLTSARAGTIHVTVRPKHTVTVSRIERGAGVPPIVVHESRRIAEALHPVRLPPRTRVEETVLDLVQAARSFDEALSWLITACSRRRTTQAALLAAMRARPRLPWRAQLASALGDIGDGVHSMLEFRYVHGVERPHKLPLASRQARRQRDTRSQYLDSLYEEFGVAVELDGRAAHEDRWRDAHRDNFMAGIGLVTLRYSWADIADHGCEVAAEIGRVLRRRGWNGSPSRCGTSCAC
jgi:hypothetical protein